MHGDVTLWMQRCLDKLTDNPPRNILEIGGRDVNGVNRPLYGDAAVTVIDIVDGQNVNVVADGATWNGASGYDLIVTTECVEHTPVGQQICENALRLLAPDGHFILTTAAPCRDPHSGFDGRPLRDSEWTDDPDKVEPGREFYRNVSKAMLTRWLDGFVGVEIDEIGCDIRAFARKPLRPKHSAAEMSKILGFDVTEGPAAPESEVALGVQPVAVAPPTEDMSEPEPVEVPLGDQPLPVASATVEEAEETDERD